MCCLWRSLSYKSTRDYLRNHFQVYCENDETYKFSLYEREKVLYYCIVYPDDLKVKLFKLTENGYSKEGDYFRETYTFEQSNCKASIDFGEVFERFR